jgi:phospholipase/carboxylesterase
MNTSLLDAVEINPLQPPRAAIIWLHGLGADGHDFEPLIPQLDIVDSLGVRVLLPHAPRRPITINAGMLMPAWYDIPAADFSRGQDSEGIRASELQLRALIAHEVSRGIPAANILLAGFSQGGAIALHTGLRYPEPLAGILALSTYLPLAARLEVEMSAANRTIPIMLAHGTHDPVVPLQLAEASRDRLQQAGYHVDWYTYAMPHAVYPEEVAEVRRWLMRRLDPGAAPGPRSR